MKNFSLISRKNLRRSDENRRGSCYRGEGNWNKKSRTRPDCHQWQRSVFGGMEPFQPADSRLDLTARGRLLERFAGVRRDALTGARV